MNVELEEYVKLLLNAREYGGMLKNKELVPGIRGASLSQLSLIKERLKYIKRPEEEFSLEQILGAIESAGCRERVILRTEVVGMYVFQKIEREIISLSIETCYTKAVMLLVEIEKKPTKEWYSRMGEYIFDFEVKTRKQYTFFSAELCANTEASKRDISKLCDRLFFEGRYTDITWDGDSLWVLPGEHLFVNDHDDCHYDLGDEEEFEETAGVEIKEMEEVYSKRVRFMKIEKFMQGRIYKLYIEPLLHIQSKSEIKNRCLKNERSFEEIADIDLEI